jgi:glucose/arabinose dehydrogenase/PKD repeat protein
MFLRRLGPAPALLLVSLLCATHASAATYPSGFEERTILGGLEQPVSMVWAPDGRLFIIEKPGRLKVARPGAAQATTILDISDRVNDYHDRGLLGLALDSDFASNGYLYLSYTYEVQPLIPDSDAPMVSRVGRYTIGAGNSVSAEQVVLGSHVSSPCPAASNTLDCLPADGLSHSIGTVTSAPDGTLWVGNGDAADYNVVDPLAFRAYDEQSMAGKIFHVDRDGRGLPGHPFCPSDTDLSHACTKVHSKGFRNPFRFKLRPNGSLTVGDVGWGTREEVDLIAAGGRSYGWPCYEGTIRTPGYRDLSECEREYAKEGTADAHVGPDHDYQHGSAGNAVMAGPEYTGLDYPAGYRGDVFFADYAEGFIRRLKLGGSGEVISVAPFASGWLGVDLQATPGGDLAYPDFDGAIKEIEYTPGNASPTAVLRASPSSGRAPLAVQFDATGSSDPDGDTLSYDWNFGDGTAHSSEQRPLHTYTAGGVYTARLTVSDGRGRSDTKTTTIAVNAFPPTAEIQSPAEGSLYRDGQTIELHGAATDSEDGTLPPLAYEWTVRLRHGGHFHLVTTFTGVVDPSFTALRDHDADSYYEIELTVTDSGGLTGSSTIDLRPETVELTLDSVPRGAQLSYSGIAGVAPMARTAAIGYRTTISAGDRFVADGHDWVFDHWSDGGPRTHDITVPTSTTTLTAYYGESSATVDVIAAPASGDAQPAPATPAASAPPPADTPDLMPPRVRVTAPARRAVVSGRIAVRASASDNVVVHAVRFKLDGKKLGKADSRAPFRVRWDTRRARNGVHRLTAVARDAAGNTATSRAVRVTVRNGRPWCGGRLQAGQPRRARCRATPRG